MGKTYEQIFNEFEGTAVSPFFWLSSTVILISGTMFVMWLGEMITEHGIGNGMSLLIFFSIIESFPAATGRTWEAFMLGEIGAFALVALLGVLIGEGILNAFYIFGVNAAL